MSSARELLDQADALMRRNRRPPRGDDIPELTDAVGDEVLARAEKPPRAEAARPSELAAPETVDDIPELTEAVEEIEAPSIQEYFDDPDELSRWLGEDDSRIADRGLPDSIAAYPPARQEPGHAVPVEVAARADAAAPLESIVPIDTLIPVEAPESAFAPTPGNVTVHAFARESEAEPAEETVVEVFPVAEFAEDRPADETLATDEVPALAAPGDVISGPPVDAPVPIEVSTSAFAQMPAAATPHAFARVPEAEPTEPTEETVVDVPAVAALAEARPDDGVLAADDVPATVAPGDVIAQPPVDADDPEHWKSLAEEIRMQVLQRIDIFTDTGLREQLTARLQPVVDRASADLVATINREVGQLLRTYVAEAVEREIEQWRHGGE